jgi:RimJ/RimL family protein N-acetyltransferase
MTTAYFQDALARYRATRAGFLGCEPEDFDRHSLVIVERPDGPNSKFALMALTLGTGTVVSVAPDYLDWTRENAPKDKHYRALFPNALLQPLAEEAARRGETLGWRSPNLSFLPADEIAGLPVPEGLRAMPFDAAQRDAWYPAGEFHNALGELDQEEEGFEYGVAIMDGDTPAAVAGAWDDCDGLKEIGVDVARAYRGRRLAPVVVTQLAQLIRERGAIPTYYCAPTNVRSHRNAIACGFTPVASAARASYSPPAPA